MWVCVWNSFRGWNKIRWFIIIVRLKRHDMVIWDSQEVGNDSSSSSSPSPSSLSQTSTSIVYVYIYIYIHDICTRYPCFMARRGSGHPQNRCTPVAHWPERRHLQDGPSWSSKLQNHIKMVNEVKPHQILMKWSNHIIWENHIILENLVKSGSKKKDINHLSASFAVTTNLYKQEKTYYGVIFLSHE